MKPTDKMKNVNIVIRKYSQNPRSFRQSSQINPIFVWKLTLASRTEFYWMAATINLYSFCTLSLYSTRELNITWSLQVWETHHTRITSKQVKWIEICGIRENGFLEKRIYAQMGKVDEAFPLFQYIFWKLKRNWCNCYLNSTVMSQLLRNLDLFSFFFFSYIRISSLWTIKHFVPQIFPVSFCIRGNNK